MNGSCVIRGVEETRKHVKGQWAPGSLSMPVWPFARAHKSFQSRAIQINSPYMKPVLPRSVCFLPTAASLPYKSFAYNINTSRRSFFGFGKATTTPQTSAIMSSATSFHEFKPLDKKGNVYDLSKLKGKVVLVVNTASKCGFTPQFEGLEKLYKELKAAHPNDVEFLGFPCNQFGSQDPGNNDTIQEFCQLNYGVSFPVLGKTDVNGDKAEPVFEWMKSEQPGLMGLKRVKWNFEKFLIGKDGKVKGRWASTTKPESLKAPIEAQLKA